jgi:uncharacterized protein (TIGR00266 family)
MARAAPGDTSSGRVARGGVHFRVLGGGGPGASLQVTLSKGQRVKAESDALVSKSAHVQLGAAMDGGFWGALVRSALVQESMFLQTLTAARDDQDALLAPQQLGDIMLLDVQPNAGYAVASGAFLAADEGVDLASSSNWSVRKSLLGSGMFTVRATGSGTLAINAYGALVHYELATGETRAVDNGHAVAWSDGMAYEVRMATSSVFGSVASGEGVMQFFSGPGHLYVQTHKTPLAAAAQGSTARRNPSQMCLLVLVMLFFCLVVVIVLVSVAMNAGSVQIEPSPYRSRGRGR